MHFFGFQGVNLRRRVAHSAGRGEILEWTLLYHFVSAAQSHSAEVATQIVLGLELPSVLASRYAPPWECFECLLRGGQANSTVSSPTILCEVPSNSLEWSQGGIVVK